MKKQKSREMSGEQPAAPGKTEVKIKRLICRHECEAPGHGTWKAGDILTDPFLVERFKHNPNFEVIKEA